MKIGIIGSGDIGQRLDDGFMEFGHTVKIGSRDPNQKKVTEWIDKHDKEEYHQEHLLKQQHLVNSAC